MIFLVHKICAVIEHFEVDEIADSKWKKRCGTPVGISWNFLSSRKRSRYSTQCKIYLFTFEFIQIHV